MLGQALQLLSVGWWVCLKRPGEPRVARSIVSQWEANNLWYSINPMVSVLGGGVWIISSDTHTISWLSRYTDTDVATTVQKMSAPWSLSPVRKHWKTQKKHFFLMHPWQKLYPHHQAKLSLLNSTVTCCVKSVKGRKGSNVACLQSFCNLRPLLWQHQVHVSGRSREYQLVLVWVWHIDYCIWWTTWLLKSHFCTVGVSGDAASIFIHSQWCNRHVGNSLELVKRTGHQPFSDFWKLRIEPGIFDRTRVALCLLMCKSHWFICILVCFRLQFVWTRNMLCFLEYLSGGLYHF